MDISFKGNHFPPISTSFASRNRQLKFQSLLRNQGDSMSNQGEKCQHFFFGILIKKI